jgi:hypothetical protein
MQYIALAFDTLEPQLSSVTSDVSALAQAVGYQPLADWLHMAGDGLASFVQVRHITRVVFLNCPPRKSLKFSSAGISEELFDSVLSGRPSTFEAFLANVSALYPECPYYVILGQEWFVYSYVKYYEGTLDTLANILHLNQGWETQLYNFETASYSRDSETPLVFRIMPR